MKTLREAPDLLTVEEAATFLRISRTTAYAAVNQGQIPSVRIGRTIRVPRHALENLLRGEGPS